jgi:hypothetical protein
MTLRIVPASDPLPVENIVLTIYAAPGLGKSSLSFTADKPLMLDFDKGSYRAAVRGDSVPVSAWSDIASMTAEDLAPYNTVILDTAGRALDSLSVDIIAGNPKAGRGDGSLTLQGFGTLKSRFAQWQSFLRSLKKDLVIVCHMSEEKNGDETQERIDAQGASRNEIYKSSDAMCRIRLDGRDQRYLDFDPRQGGFGKNPAQLPKIAFPDPRTNPHVLAEVIAQIKDAVNRMTEQQADARKEQELWVKAMAECDTLDCFNSTMVPLAKERKGGFGAFVKAEAKRRGYDFDKASGLYMEKQTAAVA